MEKTHQRPNDLVKMLKGNSIGEGEDSKKGIDQKKVTSIERRRGF